MSFLQNIIYFLTIFQILNLVSCNTVLKTNAKIYKNHIDVGYIQTYCILNDKGLPINEKCKTSKILYTNKGLVNDQLKSDIQRVYYDTKRGSTSPQYYLDLYNNLQDLLKRSSLHINFKSSVEHAPRKTGHDNSNVIHEMRIILMEGFYLNFGRRISGLKLNLNKTAIDKLNQIFNLYAGKTLAQKPIKGIKHTMKITSKAFKTAGIVGNNKLKLVLYKKMHKTKLNLCIKLDTGKSLCQNEKSLSVDGVKHLLINKY